MRKLSFLIILILLSAIPFSYVYGQKTTSSISGYVKDKYGNVIEAANIQITDIETGAIFGAVSNKVGHYTVSGLKPGTYQALCSFIGYQTATVKGIRLSASSDYSLNLVLAQSQQMLGDVVIMENRPHFSETKTGQTYNIDSRTISSLPSADRSLLDYTRLSPYSGNDNSMAGMDGRTTKLTIDGAIFTNSMGLSAALPGGGTPISLDAVQEMQVAIAPYDVRQSDFAGGSINVITKSGTNDFKATVYSYFHNQALRGNSVYGGNLGERDKESKYVTGLTVGGPILKNRIFYFVNLERTSSPGPITEYRMSSDGIGNSSSLISRVTEKDMDAFRTALQKYGYDPGSTDLSEGGTTNDKILARIDWNISNRHKLMLRGNWTNSSQLFGPNEKSTVGSKLAGNRIGDKAYAFSNNCYTINDLAWSAVAELNSSLGTRGNLGNRLALTVSEVSNKRSSNSSWFPHIDIMKDGDAFMSAGYELFSNGTGNDVRNWVVSDNLSWSAGHSDFVFGASYQYQKVSTNYRMYGTGYYRYSSLEDFANQSRPVAFGLTYAYDDSDDPSSRVNYGQTAAYIQGETRIADRLSMTYGIRADVLSFYDDYATNLPVSRLDWTWHFNTPGTESPDYKSPVLDTGAWPATSTQISPRFGFNWDVTGNETIVIHGGTGLFRGRIPMVFLTCIPNSSGMLQNTVSDSGNAGYLDDLENNFLYTEESLRKYVASHGARMEAGEGILGKGATVYSVAENFRMPSVFKSSLAADFNFDAPFPIEFGLEGIFSKDINAIYVENWNQQDMRSAGRFQGPDRRRNFNGVPSVQENISKTGGAMVLNNANNGYSWSACISFAANPLKNLRTELSFIHTESYTVSDMMGSALASTWSNTPNVNSPNEHRLMKSAYAIPDKLTASVTYSKDWNRPAIGSTEVGLFYVGQTAGTYSYLYTNDMNGDGVNNDLIYIPANRDELLFADINETDANGNKTTVYTAQEQSDWFWAFVMTDRYLSKHRGDYAGANEARMPWLNRFDLHLSQQFLLAGLIHGSKASHEHKESLTLSVDILNAANLICDKWGVAQVTSSCNNGRILTCIGTLEGEPVYQFATNGDHLINRIFEPQKTMSNCWYLQFGLKLGF